MTLEQLTYTPNKDQSSNERPETMVMMVDDDMLLKYQKDPSIPLAQVVDSFDVYKYDAGRSGRLGRPSKQEIVDTFGTSNDDEIVKFMLENGQVHGKPIKGRTAALL